MFAIVFDTAGAGQAEHVVRHLLWYIAIFGSFTSTVFLGMVVVAVFRYVQTCAQSSGRRRSPSRREDLPPVTVLKPVHGLEPRLEETLESFFRQDYPDFEIIFGARSADNEALAAVEKLRARYPNVRTQSRASQAIHRGPTRRFSRWPR